MRAAAHYSFDRNSQRPPKRTGEKRTSARSQTIHLQKPTQIVTYSTILYRSTSYLAAGLLGRTHGRPGLVEGARRRLRAGDEEAAGGGVLAGVVHRAGAHVVVRALVRGHQDRHVLQASLHLHACTITNQSMHTHSELLIRSSRRGNDVAKFWLPACAPGSPARRCTGSRLSGTGCPWRPSASTSSIGTRRSSARTRISLVNLGVEIMEQSS